MWVFAPLVASYIFFSASKPALRNAGNIFDGGFDLPAPAPQQEEVPQGFSFRLNQLEQLREVEQMMAQYEAEIDREN